MLSTLLCILAIILLFALTILVHEGGHFLAARFLGLVADTFSIGMGPALWRRRIGSTTYKIGLLPIGGYVALPQMDPNSFLEADPTDPSAPPPRNLPRIAPWKKIIVAVAGAAGNILFAFLLATIVWHVGKPASLQEQNSTIGYVAPESAAFSAGLAEGDTIVAANSRPVSTWTALTEAVALSATDSIDLLVRSPDATERTVTLPTEDSGMGFRVLAGIDGMTPCLVASTFPNSGAAAAGLRPGDRLTALDGAPLYSRAHLVRLLALNGTAPVSVTYRRGSATATVTITPVWDDEDSRPLLGVVFNTLDDLDETARTHPSPWTQVKGHATSLFNFFRALFTPSTSKAAAGAVGGPVMIFTMYWLMIRSSFVLALWFTAFLNVNLAIVNLLPIPVLDGGHVIYGLWEIVTRRPISARVVNTLANLFAGLLILLFLYLTFRDTLRNWSLWTAPSSPEVTTPAVFSDEPPSE